MDDLAELKDSDLVGYISVLMQDGGLYSNKPAKRFMAAGTLRSVGAAGSTYGEGHTRKFAHYEYILHKEIFSGENEDL